MTIKKNLSEGKLNHGVSSDIFQSKKKEAVTTIQRTQKYELLFEKF